MSAPGHPYGFDPDTFHLKRIPAPDWASTAQTFSTGLDEDVKRQVNEQQQDLLKSVQNVLQWALTDSEAVARFQPFSAYSEGVNGNYYAGRQHIEPDAERSGAIIVETECCLTRADYRQLPAVYRRYIVTLRWDTNVRTGQPVFARETERESEIAKLNLRLVRTYSLADVTNQHDLSSQSRQWLLKHWEEAVLCLHQAAQETIDDGSSSGELDFSFFPSRVDMSGKYYIDSIITLGKSDSSVCIMLHFLENPRMSGQTDFDYLGYDLSLTVTEEGKMTYEIWGSSAI